MSAINCPYALWKNMFFLECCTKIFHFIFCCWQLYILWTKLPCYYLPNLSNNYWHWCSWYTKSICYLSVSSLIRKIIKSHCYFLFYGDGDTHIRNLSFKERPELVTEIHEALFKHPKVLFPFFCNHCSIYKILPPLVRPSWSCPKSSGFSILLRLRAFAIIPKRTSLLSMMDISFACLIL